MQRSAPRKHWAQRVALACATALVALAAPGSSPALADPPTTTDFLIYYYITDAEGNRGRQMSQQDMELFVNQARCECGQKIVSRVTFQGDSTSQDQLNVYVGQNCAQAQANAGIGQYAPCALLASGAPQGFQNGPEYLFDPIFLAYGVAGTDQSIATATPAGQCSGLEGQGGLWMCSGANACQMGDFFMQGTTNNNVPEVGISYDFIPPLNAPTDFDVEPGDNSVTITWNVTAVPEAGYRVLCADENGNPINNGVSVGNIDETSIVNGTIYYTTSNLCPDQQAGDGDGDPTTGDGDGDPGGDMGCVQGSEGCDCYNDDTCDDLLVCNAGVCEDISCTAGEPSCICTSEGTCNPGATCEGNICVPVTTGIETLDWDYVCTEHLAYSSREARITGLENGQTYKFIVVAYDRAGNYIQSETITGTPVPTSGLWEECEAQGGICGEAWNCNCEVPSERGSGGLGWLFGGLAFAGLGFGVARRRRRRA